MYTAFYIFAFLQLNYVPLSATLYNNRFHAIDNLRAAMMLLGVVLHSALAYAVYTLGVTSAYHDRNDSYLLSAVTFTIHMFRMQAFFVVAGFMGAMLFAKYGAKGMLRNRVKRILVPLVLSWVLLFPLTILGAAFTVLGGPRGVSTVIQQLQSGEVLAKNDMTFTDLLTQLGLIHLWFLYYLMIYYLLAVSVTFIVRRITALRLDINLWFKGILARPLGIVGFAFITILTMYNMQPATTAKAGFENSNAILPYWPVLLAYWVFFSFGWMLFKNSQLLAVFIKRVWANALCGVCFSALYAYLIFYPPVQYAHIAQIALAALATWFLVFGVIGLFLRYAEKPSRTARYLADASYWVYIIHLPFTLFLPGLFIDLDIPGIVKFLLVSGITMALSLITYHYFVRSTLIGQILSGRRIPRKQ